MTKTPDFVIASSPHYTGFHSTNLRIPIHGYAPRNVEDCVQYIRENWEDSTITSDSLFDNIEDKRPYTEKDLVYTNKIKTRLKKLENNLLLTNLKKRDTLNK